MPPLSGNAPPCTAWPSAIEPKARAARAAKARKSRLLEVAIDVQNEVNRAHGIVLLAETARPVRREIKHGVVAAGLPCREVDRGCARGDPVSRIQREAPGRGGLSHGDV